MNTCQLIQSELLYTIFYNGSFVSSDIKISIIIRKKNKNID
jgi:hypothetical protein